MIALQAIATQLVPRRHRPDVGLDSPFAGEKPLSIQCPRDPHPAGQDLGSRAHSIRRGRAHQVHATQNAVDIHALGLRGLRDGFVVHGQVVEDVLRCIAVHPAQPVADDVAQFVGKGRVIRHHRGVGGSDQQRVTVLMLQPFSVESGAPRRGPQDEAPGHLVKRYPERVAGALEPEHRVEDVDRDHGLAVRGVRRAGGEERSDRTGLVDSFVQDLTVHGFLVRQHQFPVDRGIGLPVRRVDLEGREQAVHAERARLVGDDRDEP